MTGPNPSTLSNIETIETIEQLEDLLSHPTPAAIDALANVPGDIMLLGAGGKMGPTLAHMAKRAAGPGPGPGPGAGDQRRVIAVSRFNDEQTRAALESRGIETIRGDLLDPATLDRLPDAANIIYMPALKFGSDGDQPLTWATNAYLPAMVCRRFERSRIVAFSTGNVYPLVPATSDGCDENVTPTPVGEYAMSCLGRERMFEYFSQTMATHVAVIRLNYAVEMRYGVLVDLARRVWNRQPIDVTTCYVNVIWQGDANAMVLAALAHAATPPFVVNVAGEPVLDVRQVCQRYCDLMNRPVRFVGEPAADALLSDGRRGRQLLGPTRVTTDQLINWTADWIMRGGETLDKPTHFEVRDGKF